MRLGLVRRPASSSSHAYTRALTDETPTRISFSRSGKTALETPAFACIQPTRSLYQYQRVHRRDGSPMRSRKLYQETGNAPKAMS